MVRGRKLTRLVDERYGSPLVSSRCLDFLGGSFPRKLRFRSLQGAVVTEVSPFFGNPFRSGFGLMTFLPFYLGSWDRLVYVLRSRLPSKMGNLVNLHYLDIKGAYLIERIPFRIDKLTNLQRLSDFIIAEGDGCHIRYLKYLSNLEGDFRLSGLENVNGEDAGEAKLNEKQGIHRLVLHWSEKFKKASRNKEVEEWVLDSLRSPKKLEQLVIQNYGGAKFSTWIADPSFKNMLSLELSNCKNCKSLPSIGRLLLLKDLSIRGLDQVHKIGAELFGENQSNVFASLESLRFGNMLNWEEWDLCEDDEQVSKFPSLRFLSIRECPLLLGRLPTIIQSLQTLEIYECQRLVVSISSFPLLCELRVEGCEELVDEGSLSVQKVTSLKTVSVSNISNFNISAERAMLRFTNSETFKISGWKELGSLSQNGLSIVGHRFITIWNCPQLVSLETKEEILQLDKIPGVESLEIANCERLNRLPEALHAFPLITRIQLRKCPGLVCFAESNFPHALKELRIGDCVNLQYLVDEKENNNKSMSSNTCLLERLKISNCPSLIWLSSRGDICNRLQHLEIESCSKLSRRGFPTNLTSLEITNAPKIYTSLVEWGFNRLTSLQKLNISGEGWSRVVSFPEETIGMMLPPSLTDISIQIFENLEFMCSKGLQHLTSLQQLGIYDCPKLASLPEKDVLLSLERLDIQRCPSLEEGCNRGKGREWSKISHIPYVQIDKNIVIPSMEHTLSRYNKGIEEDHSQEHPFDEQQAEKLQGIEVNTMKQEYLRLHTEYMRLNGKELDDLSFKELKQLEDQLNEGIASVERQKEQILMEQLKRSRLQEQKTIMENEDLRKQVEELRQKGSSNILELNPLLERRLDHSPNNSKADDNNSASDDDNHLSDTSLHLGLTSNIGRKRKATEIEPTTNDSGSQVASE
ncbi:hypothetical protein GOBAR_DD21650 [Gossypium barbadense]|nr:hypothetical protein GOBAR_DD21650 [Gossypium barbadense]